MRTHGCSPRVACHVPCSREPRRRVPRPALGALGNVSKGEWPEMLLKLLRLRRTQLIAPLSLPPTRSAAVQDMQGLRCPGGHLPAALPRLQRYSHSNALGPGRAAGKLSDPHGRRQRVAWGAQAGAGGAAAGAPRSCREGPDARRTPAPAAGNGWQSNAAPLASHRWRPRTPVADAQAPESAPGSALGSHRDERLWRPRRAWTRRGRAFRSSPPRVCQALRALQP